MAKAAETARAVERFEIHRQVVEKEKKEASVRERERKTNKEEKRKRREPRQGESYTCSSPDLNDPRTRR